MSNEVILRLRKKITCRENDTIKLGDLAFIEAEEETKARLNALPIHHVRKKDGEYIVIELFILLVILRKLVPEYHVEWVGPEETIVEVKQAKRQPSILFLFLVWLVLLIGTAMTIMNFHYDVSMPEVHEKLHYLLTGEKNSRPYWIQIPYSLGLGIGMILFLNHWFKKRINEEPSPLELEMYKYEEDINQYIRHFENELNDEQRYF